MRRGGDKAGFWLSKKENCRKVTNSLIEKKKKGEKKENRSKSDLGEKTGAVETKAEVQLRGREWKRGEGKREKRKAVAVTIMKISLVWGEIKGGKRGTRHVTYTKQATSAGGGTRVPFFKKTVENRARRWKIPLNVDPLRSGNRRPKSHWREPTSKGIRRILAHGRDVRQGLEVHNTLQGKNSKNDALARGFQMKGGNQG